MKKLLSIILAACLMLPINANAKPKNINYSSLNKNDVHYVSSIIRKIDDEHSYEGVILKHKKTRKLFLVLYLSNDVCSAVRYAIHTDAINLEEADEADFIDETQKNSIGSYYRDFLCERNNNQ